MQALLQAIASMPLVSQAQRLFHGRGGLHPGSEHWQLDVFAPVFLLTRFGPASEAELECIGAALARRWAEIAPDQPLTWVYQCRQGAQVQSRLMAGSVPEPHVVQEAGARYRVHLLRGQNHGLFLDMAAGRRWVHDYCAQQRGQGLRVLNLFAYTCAFSVAALQGGAQQVVNVDMAQGAMAIGQHNHQLNGLQAGASFWVHDIFKSWGKIGRAGPYGLIIVDPPSYQKGSFVATKDYARLLRRLPELLQPEGQVLLCLNAPELDCDFLQQLVQAQAPGLVFAERLVNPVAFADAQPERALKVLRYRKAAG